jgi:dTDP-4-dehydrorhamnose reductase
MLNKIPKKTILITGHTGMLGKDILEILKQNKNIEIIGLSRKKNNSLSIKQIELDLCQTEKITAILNYINPNTIIHTSAIVNLETCEKNKIQTHKLHIDATKKIASFNHEKTKFIYISTDSVFDGIKGNYSEEDIPNPLNNYAKTKFQGEITALKANKNTLVLRTNLYGMSQPNGKSIAEWAINKLKNNKTITGFSDIKFNPLYTKQCARIIEFFLERNTNGIINIGTTQQLSKYEFLKKIAKEFELNPTLILKGTSTQLNLHPKRPQNTTLNLNKLKKLLSQKNNSTIFSNIDIINGIKEFKENYVKI